MTKKELILHLDEEYRSFLSTLKTQVRSAQLKAAIAVNQELIALYWRIGAKIVEKQLKASWGDNFLQTLSKDLQAAFPETYGFSVTNIQRMRQFAQEYPSIEIQAQAVPKLPWGHIILLIQRVKKNTTREWYAQQCIENGWSRHALERYIKNNLFEAQGIETNKATNFLTRLPSPQSGLAQDLIKSPYNFDFLGLHDEAHEREIEHASIKHITKFMLELGKGFAFVGSQVPITINDSEFFIDMLFYNLQLRCFTVLEIKADKFKPEHVGQLNFYLSAVDDIFKHPGDNPSIGLLLCKSRDKIVAEYALKNVEKPIGVSAYELTKALPKKLQGIMPSVEELEAELSGESKEKK